MLQSSSALIATNSWLHSVCCYPFYTYITKLGKLCLKGMHAVMVASH